MTQRGDFEFLPHFCTTCKEELILNRKFINSYESRGYPKFHRKCHPKISRPDRSILNKLQVGSLNPNFGNHSRLGMKFPEEWKNNIRKGELNYQKKKKEAIAINDFKEKQVVLPLQDQKIPEIKPEIQIPITPTILSEQEKISIALSRLESQRLQKVKEFEARPKPKEIVKKESTFGLRKCIRTEKIIKCVLHKVFCRDYTLCHQGDKK